MGMVRGRFTLMLGVMALTVASCGGGDEGGAPEDPGPESAGPATTVAGGGDAGGSSDQEGNATASGERMAVISVDGETLSYDLDDVTYSNVDGVEDLTFETCSPDFFGSGRFYAIGYAVDANGDVLVGDDGQITGAFSMDLPPEDWEAAERDAPTFDLDVNGLDLRIATPEEAAGGEMTWSMDDTSVTGSAVFVDYEKSYTVEFEIVCEGSPTVSADAGSGNGDSEGDDGSQGGGSVFAGAAAGSFTADGEAFDNVDVYSCEPFSFGSQEADPNDLRLVALTGSSSGLEVEVSYGQGIDMSNGAQFEQITVSVFHSRQGAAGLEQFETTAFNDAAGDWFVRTETGEELQLSDAPAVIDGNHVIGSLAGLIQTWPDEGAATVDVTFDFEIPTQVNEC